jgi:superfamily II DNA or RNA helicase
MFEREKKQKELIEAIITNKYSGVFIAAPRFGKTYCILQALKPIQHLEILVVCPTNAIIESWKQECIKWGYTGNLTYIHRNYLSSIDLSKFRLIVKDECHLLAESEIPLLLGSKLPIVAITGSLSKHNKDKLFYRLGLKVKFEYNVKEAVEDSIVSDYVINLHYCQLNEIERKKYNQLTATINYHKELGNYKFALNKAGERARLIYASEDKINKAKQVIKKYKRVLVYSALTAIANKLCRVTYHSKTKKGKDNLPKFQTGKINKLAAVGMLDMGITILNLKHCVIHQLNSVEERAIQRVLRVMNYENGKNAVIDIFCVEDTVDEDWINKALAFVPESKINVLKTT